VKLSHFNTLKPVCPLCSRDRSESFPLEIGSAFKEMKDGISEGVLVCTNAGCRCEYPVIDGIPLIVPDIRAYVSGNILPILSRDDLSGETLSLLGDCCGPGSAFDLCRYHLSSYAFDHYGDLDPMEDGKCPSPPGSVLGLLNRGLGLAPGPVPGPVADLGCAVGRTTFELAEVSGDLVLGVDLNFDMLRLGAAVLNRGEVVYPRRSIGLVYDLRRFAARFGGASRVDFWAADATALPFSDNTFEFAASLNLLDCVTSPYDHLKTLARVLRPGARAILSTPYDWSSAATPVQSWLGGHSQRSETRGASEAVLRSLLAGGDHPKAVRELELLAEAEAEEWLVRLHDRGAMRYRAHLAAVRVSK
jgi:SAM-dependent methyltransferase/uncharacterized protein YbaR (Trm112 family)